MNNNTNKSAWLCTSSERLFLSPVVLIPQNNPLMRYFQITVWLAQCELITNGNINNTSTTQRPGKWATTRHTHTWTHPFYTRLLCLICRDGNVFGLQRSGAHLRSSAFVRRAASPRLASTRGARAQVHTAEIK